MLYKIKNRLVRFIQAQDFVPSFWGVWVNPFFIARKGLYDAIKPLGHYVQGKTLDIGCGRKPYEHLFKSTEYIGLELDSPENRQYKQADQYYDGKALPFENSNVDSIVTHQVFEHVFTPDQFLSEIHRVLKPNGVLMLSVPFVWDEHEQPNDFARYSSFGLKSLLKKHGFDIIEQKKTVQNLGLLFQLFNAYCYKKWFGSNGYWNQLLCLVLMAPITLIGLLFGILLPNNADLYLDNVLIAQKPSK